MTALFHHLAYDFKTGIRDRSRLLMLYLFPLVFFALVGALMASINPGFKETMIPAMVVFTVMCGTLLSLPSLLVNAREAAVFRSYRINGVPSASILSVPVIGTAVHMAVVSVLIWAVAARFYGGAAPHDVLGFAGVAGLSYLAYAGIGVLIGVAAGNTSLSILLGQLIYIPSIILGGLMVPPSVLPAALRRIGLLLPATHSMRAFAAVGAGAASGPGAAGVSGAAGLSWAAGFSGPAGSVGVLAAGAVLSFVLAAVLFQWDTRASQPNRKALAALLALVPYVAAALLG
jgi:ABC-2 type transport system permease protein